MKSISTARVLVPVVLFVVLPFATYSQGNSCGTAVTLTPSAICTPTAGNLKNAPNASPTGACGGATSTTTYSGWFQFTATSSNPLITVSGLGSSLTAATTYIEVLSGTCGSLTSYACQNVSTSLSLSGLTSGTTYFVRVYVTNNPNSGGNPSQYDFSICIQSRNDDCIGAISLNTASSCSNTAGTVNNATATSGLPAGCETGGTHYDVWYQFVAASTYELISISSLGTSFTSPQIQLYSGGCGSLTSLQCGTTSMTATGLTVGNTYYVRVSNVGSAVASNGGFNICIYHPTASTYDYSKSYVNITKGTGGGTINPGDTLEIRGTFVVRNTGSAFDSLAFFDTLHLGGGVRLVPGTIALRTNEGKVYRRDSPVKSPFTDAFDSDAGYYYTSGSDTVVRINFGVGASGAARGRLANTDRPSVFNSTCIIMATYRVVVYASYGSTINLGGGAITMRDVNTGIANNLSFSTRNAVVYSSPGLCPNAVSATNAIGGDFNGTFGTPAGSPPYARNRGTSPNVIGYTYNTFSSAANAPQDYYYGIANNTSGNFTTSTTWAKPDISPSHRIFNVWDITGDHTSATNTAKGNPPCDTTKPISSANPCGYMLVINSAYKTDTAFQYTVTNLCPNTYYEISGWVKNICYKCSCDSNGVGASGAGYIPFAPNDSSGVQPNLAFDINGTDYYTTGNIAYAGIYPTTQAGSDSTNIWVKRGFTYLTGGTQSSLTLTIRNNAPGGGGNDWALDDIALATCLPNMQYSPSLSPATCQNNPSLVINDTVRSYFNNYSNYKWQKSTDGGTTWTDVTSAASTTPTWNGSAYQYVTSYNIPQGSTTMADSGTKYRVVVATTSSNLSNSSCLFTDGVSIITLTVNSCVPILDVNLLSFNGKITNHNADLFWRTSKEFEAVSFTIEKSLDGVHFSPIASLNGHGNGAQNNYYNYTDPASISGTVFYRIGMMNSSGKIKYSQIISLRDESINFSLVNVINPFTNEVNFEIAVPENATIEAVLTSLSGKPLRRESFVAYEGVNSLTMPGLELLPAGMYVLQVNYKEKIINRKLVKR
ncbi:MAG TPA: T9SS type A sorting domain-containing protein [Chitinophagaceae bacterium]|nr:T9SS type A sorting domain-containing protein [Chitinophagaceae bacterium]